MSEDVHSVADRTDYFFGDFRLDQLFAVDRSGRNDCIVRIDNRGRAAEGKSVIRASSISQDDVALVFNRTRQRQDSQVFNADEGPRRGVNEDVDVMLDGVVAQFEIGRL